jgi:SpoIID/LytB domain protein
VVHLKGHGYGPGIGMGQWGAFGYAAVEHQSYEWILEHFYGGTSLITMRADPTISVDIIENENLPVEVTSESPFTFGGVKFPAGAVVRALLTANGWQLRTGSSCSATAWGLVTKGLKDPVAVPASTKSTAPAHDLLTLCRGDGQQVTYRGEMEAYDDGGSSRTLNLLPLGQYVADVVPSESSSGWGQYGGAGPQGEPWGFQSLEAQAIAVRTYAVAYQADGGWSSGYADICDSDFCQSYPGIVNESALSTAAVHRTARVMLTVSGAPAQIQYSASTGGYTTASSFPAVADLGDSVCLTTTGWTCNPDHTWTTTVRVSDIEAQFPSIGKLASVAVSERNGYGAWKGRVISMVFTGSSGSVTESGDAFQSQFGLMSDWFVIQHPQPAPADQPSSAGQPGPPPPPGPGTGPLPHQGLHR